MEQPLFTLQTYTPGSDLAAGVRGSQILSGRTGNDTLLGYQPLTATPSQTQIDILIGDLTIEDPGFRQWSDTFIFGDWTTPYYANGNPDIFGLNDFGFLGDFNSAQDTVQLHGTANDYQLLDIGVGSTLLLQQENVFDVVGFFLGNSNLNLDSHSFNFAGYTPPPGPVLPQVQQLGTSGFELSVATATDTLGNVYTVGGTTGSLAGTNSGESRDALVVKYDDQGNQLWTKQIGVEDFDTISDIATDNEGNFYVAGITAGDLAGTKNAESTDAFVAKYDSDGNPLWIQQFGESIIFQTFGIDVDDDGNAYLSGINVKSASSIASATDDFWVTKFDTNGNQQWFTEVGTENDTFDESYGITVGKDGNVYATGWTLGDLEGENAGLYDIWVAQLDNSTGDLQWINQSGTPDYEWSWGVDTDSQGNVYTTGWTLGDLGGTGNAGSYDSWLTKYDNLGNPLWTQQFGSIGDDEAFDIYIDSLDNIFLTGYTNGNLGGDNAGSFDNWVAKYDTNGNQVWVQQFGTSALEQAYGITGDNAGNLYVTGVTEGSLGATNAGSVDSWLAKLDAATGNLLDFGGTPNPGNTLPALDFIISDSSESLIINEQAVDFITSFFEDFLASTGIESDGSGLVTLASNPYGQPTPVPEALSGISLLMFAAFVGIGAMLRRKFVKG